ncbi:MAG TPA: aspartyl beta-hydroxylase, partial [Alphaproteobacteria bacterium]|nr:aspartyl beta-hydroxylase [Alphaproteobacteria bacterium]
GILREIGSEFEAYVQKEATEPLNQWAELNKSQRWSALFLYKDGTRIDHICRRAPKTLAILERIPRLDIPGRGPTAFFSALDAKTHIPPHTGVNNIRSIVHLPLIVPENTWFRVGNDKRPFKRGEAWVFDDSIEHEAMNDSDERRIILIFDVW